MTVARFAISLDRDLARQIRRSAAGEPTSAWLADAARRKLRSEGLMDVVRAWENEHGEITDQEVRAAEREQMLALKRRKRRHK
ncbi:MAG: hypothetical protein H0T89_24705 [Deltaproteobacteria bacterium]|nr:hypothetical protein [Deltaproteobacteria bacterium]MDQ3295505.1 hypothetical protein [Myxococcota bacterium]